MSRQHQLTRTPRTLVMAYYAAALALAGCGAGQVTQTDSQVAAVDGTDGDIGDIALRNVQLYYPGDHHGSYPLGSDVPLRLTIINQGNTADILESVSTPVAAQVLLQGASTIPAATSVATPLEAAVTTRPGDPDPGVSTTPSPPPVSPLDFGEIRIVLVNITQPLRAGLNTEITFVFRNAGPVTIPVPLGPPTHSEREPLDGGGH